MKRQTLQTEIDKFSMRLLRHHSDCVRQEMIDDPSPFFMSRLRARISQEKQLSQFWELGVVSARRWLVALSCVALLFFFGNLVAVGTQTRLLSHTPIESSHNEPEDGDDVHSEALNVDMLQKE